MLSLHHRRRLSSLAALIVVFTCSAVFAQAQPNDPETFGEIDVLSWPELVFEDAAAIDTMYNVIYNLTMATFVAVGVCMVLFLIRYRHRPGRRAVFIHGNSKLEVAWTLIPTIILALIAALSQDTWSKMKYPDDPGPNDLQIRIVGKQFKWYFQYPGKDGVLGEVKTELMRPASQDIVEVMGLDRSGAGADDLVTTELVAPVNTRVFAKLLSVDVIHSFFLPNFRVKQDAVPGMETNIWFAANRTSGEVIGRDPLTPLTVTDPETFAYINITHDKPFEILCAELCGNGHYTMRGAFYVLDKATFERWRDMEYARAAGGGEEEEGEDDGY